MRPSRFYRAVLGAAAFLFFSSILPVAVPPAESRQNHKLPKPKELDSGITWQRDRLTGELEIKTKGGAGEPVEAEETDKTAIRSTTQMVSVTCAVATADGTAVPGLKLPDFRVFDEGQEQKIAYFDASTQPASIAMVIDASPSVLRDSDDMKAAADALVAALQPLDQAAVVDFAAHTYLLLPFSDVRELMRRAVDRINVRDLFGDTGGSNIYEAVYLTARELFPGRTGRKAIILLTDGQDSGLGLTLDPASAAPSPALPDRLTFDDLSRLLAAENIQVFAVSTENRPKVMTPGWLAAHASQSLLSVDARELKIPAYTLYLAELVRRAGGQLYFLREAATLADTFRKVAQRIRAEYTLGYYPQREQSNPGDVRGWHHVAIRVDEPDITVSHRAAYYVPATTQ